uniref:Uncharacterized protein n=1 Tax=Rhodnius prolixus TaxID=13249 RepID=T1HCJ1_RHOPR
MKPEFLNKTQKQNAKALSGHTDQSLKPKKARMSKSKVKTMLIVFYDSKQEFVPQGQTVNAAYYVDVLERLRKRVIRTRKDISATWQLHHERATSPRVPGQTPGANAAPTPISRDEELAWKSPKTPSRTRTGHGRVAGQNV